MSFLPALDYPKNLINVMVYSDRDITHNFKHIIIDEEKAYLDMQERSQGDYLWIINADFVIQSTSLLKDLIKSNFAISSGLMVKPKTMFSNFWGALDKDGWYARAANYEDIVERKELSAYAVPYATGNLLFKTSVYKSFKNLTERHSNWDLDMCVCHNIREQGEVFHLINDEIYGYIEESHDPDVYSELGPWTEDSYFDPKFLLFLQDYEKNKENIKTNIFTELGPDIWQFPIFKPEFCDYLIELAEKKSEWSAGIYSKKNEIDPRLGGVEYYPTQDVHLKDLGLHNWWLHKIVGKCFKRVLAHLYQFPTKGYNISFIVKYTPEGQAKLDPHHDASAYTTNLALNTYGQDYTGGGCNFIHKKIECIGNLKGHIIMHPGRITHFHEAYPVKTGTRYILVSFNN